MKFVTPGTEILDKNVVAEMSIERILMFTMSL